MKKILTIITVIAAVLALAAIGYAQGCCPSEGGGSSSSSDSGSTATVRVRCPVMGCLISDVDFAPAQSEYNGKTYYFCCEECKTKFDNNPQKYLNKKAKKPARAKK
jgi:YHS domain-containing protein